MTWGPGGARFLTGLRMANTRERESATVRGISYVTRYTPGMEHHSRDTCDGGFNNRVLGISRRVYIGRKKIAVTPEAGMEATPPAAVPAVPPPTSVPGTGVAAAARPGTVDLEQATDDIEGGGNVEDESHAQQCGAADSAITGFARWHIAGTSRRETSLGMYFLLDGDALYHAGRANVRPSSARNMGWDISRRSKINDASARCFGAAEVCGREMGDGRRSARIVPGYSSRERRGRRRKGVAREAISAYRNWGKPRRLWPTQVRYPEHRRQTKQRRGAGCGGGRLPRGKFGGNRRGTSR